MVSPTSKTADVVNSETRKSETKSEKAKSSIPQTPAKRPNLDGTEEELSKTSAKKLKRKTLATVIGDTVSKQVDTVVAQIAPVDQGQTWLYEKAAASIIPSEKEATVKPDRIFSGVDPLIVHMCTPCKKHNAACETMDVGDGLVQIPLALCTVCRAHLIAQKNMKFYKHDCPSLKKKLLNL